MAQKLNDTELATFKELLMANSVEVDSVTNLLIEMGIFTEQEFYSKLKQVQAEYAEGESNDTAPNLLDALITNLIAEMPFEARFSTAN